MKFLKYAAIVPCVFLLSNLAQAIPPAPVKKPVPPVAAVKNQVLSVAAVKKTVINPGDVLTVTYTLDAKNNVGLKCDYENRPPYAYYSNTNSIANQATWTNHGVTNSHGLPLHLSANKAYHGVKTFGWGWADTTGTVKIQNSSGAKDLIVTCDYVAMPVATPAVTPFTNPQSDAQPN